MKNTNIPFYFIRLAVSRYRNLIIFRPIPRILFIKIKFFFKHLYLLNLKKPKTFNEKIQYLKINSNKKKYSDWTDKYKVRSYVSKKINKDILIPIIGYFDSIDSFKNFYPYEPCIIKATHDSGSQHKVWNNNDYDKKLIIRLVSEWFKSNYYYRSKELQYINIKPGLIVEKLLLNERGVSPNDYKLHCFHGKVHLIQVVSNRVHNYKQAFYDRDWMLLPFTYKQSKKNHLDAGSYIKPNKLDRMIEIAEKLSDKCIYIRVDLYFHNEKIYFGELTMHPESGYGRFSDPEWDLKLGSLINLNIID